MKKISVVINGLWFSKDILDYAVQLVSPITNKFF